MAGAQARAPKHQGVGEGAHRAPDMADQAFVGEATLPHTRFPGDPNTAPPLELPPRCLIPSTRQGLSAPATQLRPHSGAGGLAHPCPL